MNAFKSEIRQVHSSWRLSSTSSTLLIPNDVGYGNVADRQPRHFRVKPRWLFVKITDEEGRVGWGEGTLEGHSLAVEGALDEIIVRLIGQEAK